MVILLIGKSDVVTSTPEDSLFYHYMIIVI